MTEPADRPPAGPPDRRAVERALRGAGLSGRQAKRLLAGGWRLAFSAEPGADARALLDKLERLLTTCDRDDGG